MAEKKVTAEAIVQKWDGGERAAALGLASDASAGERDKAIQLRPGIAKRIAGDLSE